MARYAYDEGLGVFTSFAAKTAAFTGDEIAINHLGAVEVSWERQFPGAAPATQQTDLEVCNGDPTVAANWVQLDTENTVAAAEIRKTVAAPVVGTLLRARLVSITTPGGGVTAQITVRPKGKA